jgi:hypothetical protein
MSKFEISLNCDGRVAFKQVVSDPGEGDIARAIIRLCHRAETSTGTVRPGAYVVSVKAIPADAIAGSARRRPDPAPGRRPAGNLACDAGLPDPSARAQPVPGLGDRRA